MSELTSFQPPLFIVKVHAAGLKWWEEQGMPETMTIGCTTLESDPRWQRRPFIGDRRGRHFIYEAAEGLVYPTICYDTYIETYTPATLMPPHPTKYWENWREPAKIDRFPDPTPLRDLVLSLR